jgi:hypothetical protein
MRKFRGLVVGVALAIGMAGCSGIEGQVVGGCTMHETHSMMSGVAWADCGPKGLVPGQAEGYAQAYGPILGDVALAGGIIGAGVFASQINTSPQVSIP